MLIKIRKCNTKKLIKNSEKIRNSDFHTDDSILTQSADKWKVGCGSLPPIMKLVVNLSLGSILYLQTRWKLQKW